MRLRTKLIVLVVYSGLVGLSIYEITAKSQLLLGIALPGWQASQRAENSTSWNPPTGILVVDKFLHESEEAARFFGYLAKGSM